MSGEGRSNMSQERSAADGSPKRVVLGEFKPDKCPLQDEPEGVSMDDFLDAVEYKFRLKSAAKKLLSSSRPPPTAPAQENPKSVWEQAVDSIPLWGKVIGMLWLVLMVDNIVSERLKADPQEETTRWTSKTVRNIPLVGLAWEFILDTVAWVEAMYVSTWRFPMRGQLLQAIFTFVTAVSTRTAISKLLGAMAAAIRCLF